MTVEQEHEQDYRTASPDLASYRIRRERELSSLYATARSLTALGEIDAVLDSIVRHAHELIGTDFTYLSLLGGDDELILTASEGTISPAFGAARVPSGTRSRRFDSPSAGTDTSPPSTAVVTGTGART